MNNKLTKKYGLLTAICMVVGIVIGSGIFFKAQDVLNATGGNVLEGALAWIIGGAVMVVLAVTFAIMATKYEKAGGIVDYAEATCGRTYAFFIGWFMSMIYYPAMTSVVAWVTARYTMVAVFNVPSGSPEALFSSECILITAFYLVLSYFINSLAPKLAGKIQVSTTIIKLIPISFIALVGTLIGLFNGTLGENIKNATSSALPATSSGGGIFVAICATVFAYEGWIIATAINAEIKNSKRNLPIALCFGSIIVMAFYVLYYVGVLGLASRETLMNNGTSEAFKFFGTATATVINFLIIVSCFGTLNGLMLACTRGIYSLASRGEGIKPDTFEQLDVTTNIPHNSASFALFSCALWLAYFVGGQFFGWFGEYAFDSSELPIITIYPLYIPILVVFMIKSRENGIFKRFILPILSICGVVIMVIASIVRHGMDNVWYLILFCAVMLVGALFCRFGERTPIERISAYIKSKTTKK